MPNPTIRRAVAGDAQALAACIDAAYAVYAARIADLPAVSDGIAEDIRDNIVWVSIRDDRIVGGLVLIARPDHIVLANVAVDPAAAGEGIGRALIELAETETRRLDLDTLRLSTHVDMPENVRLYEHLGWRETGRSANKVTMEKRLVS